MSNSGSQKRKLRFYYRPFTIEAALALRDFVVLTLFLSTLIMWAAILVA